jgi:hypothetical protein
MKTFLTYSLVFVLLQYFVTGNLFQEVTFRISHPDHESPGPYSLIKANTDPCVLPMDQGVRHNNPYSHRIKLLSFIYTQAGTFRQFSGVLSADYYIVFGNYSQTIPCYIANCSLRI